MCFEEAGEGSLRIDTLLELAGVSFPVRVSAGSSIPEQARFQLTTGKNKAIPLADFRLLFLFTFVDLGDAGRHSDGGVLSNLESGQALEDGSLSIPHPCPLPSSTQPNLPYVIVGYEAIP